MKHFSAVVIAVGLFCLTCGNAEAGWVKTILPNANGDAILSTSGNRLATGAGVYDWNGAGWAQLGADLPGAISSLSPNGNTVAVRSNTTLSIFDWNGGSWSQVGETVSPPFTGSSTYVDASALSANGDRVVMGAASAGIMGHGQVAVYGWNGAAWFQVGEIIEGDEMSYMGRSIAISAAGTRIAAGASMAAGHIKIFDWNGSTWAQVGASIVEDTGMHGSQLGGTSARGIALSQDGSRIAGSAPGGTNNAGDLTGYIRIDAWNGGAWAQMGSKINVPEHYRSVGGRGVGFSSDGTRLVFSADRYLDTTREAFIDVYDWNGAGWTKFEETISEERVNSVSMSGAGTRIVVYSASGVHIYDYDASVTTTPPTDTDTDTDTTDTDTDTDTDTTDTDTDTDTDTTDTDTDTDTTDTDTDTTDTTTSDAPDTTSGAPTGVLENPGPSASKSGIGIISGWVCEGSIVEVVIDGITVVASYGTERTDTAGLCGDTNNGFAALYNWNRFGDGSHTAIAYVDGIQFDSSTFSVTTFGTEFLTGAAGTYTIDNFPQAGISTTLTWSQSEQNFVISNVDP